MKGVLSSIINEGKQEEESDDESPKKASSKASSKKTSFPTFPPIGRKKTSVESISDLLKNPEFYHE